MSSKPLEPEISRMKPEEIHAADRPLGEQDQQGEDTGSKSFGPENVSPRYELRMSNKNEIQQNVSAKRRVESSLLGETSTKRRRTQTPALNVSGREQTLPERSLRQRRQQIDAFQEALIGEAEFSGLINRRIQVYWNLDKAWYSGLIKRYDPTNKLHLVAYDDGDDEWVSLERDTFKIQIFVPGETPTVPNRGIGQSKCDDLEDRSIEHGEQGGIDNLQQVGTDCLQKSGVDNSQKKNSRRKVLKEKQKGDTDAVENSQKKTTSKNLLKEEQKKGVDDVSEKRNAKRGKRLHGIDDSGIEGARSSLDLTEKVKTSNEDRKSPVASVSDHSSTGADDGAVGSREPSLFRTFYTRRSRPKSSLNVHNSESGGHDVCNRVGAEGAVSDIGTFSSPCSDLGSHKVSANEYFYKRQKNSIHGVDDSSTRASSRGLGETCIGNRGDEHAAIEDLASGDRSDMELGRAPVHSEFQNSSRNLKSNIDNASKVEETCMGSREYERAAIGASELTNRSDMELEKALVKSEFQNCPQNLNTKIENASGVGEACVGRRGDGHVAMGASAASAMADHSDMVRERVPMRAKFQNCPQNLKSNIDIASGVGETCMGSRGDEHTAIGTSALVDLSATELDKVPMNAEFQNCLQNLKSNIDNSSRLGETCMGGRGNEHSAIGALTLADHSDMELEKAPMDSELQNCPQNLESNIDNGSVCALPIRFDDSTRMVAGQKGALETATSGANKEPVHTYSRKRPRKHANTDCNEVPVKRLRKLNLEETAVSPNAKGKEIIPVSMIVCKGIHGEREYENSRPSRYDEMSNCRFDKAVSNFGDDASCSTMLKPVPVSNFRFSERLDVSAALKAHMSQLFLREPSYWQCVASGLQLCKMCPVNISRNRADIEYAKLLSWENLKVFLGSMFQFLNAGFESSSSLCHTQMALQQFEVGGLLNSRKYTDLSLWECLQSMILRSDVQVELLVFDTVSKTHKLCFWGPFSEVLCNFSMSLASLMSSTANRFPAEMFGAARPLNINAPIQSISVRLSSLQSSALSPLVCNFENLDDIASANWNECRRTLNWFISSSRNLIQGESSKSSLGNLHRSSHHIGYRGKVLVRAGALCKYKQGAEVVNVFKRSVENQHFASSLFQRFNSQCVSAGCVNQSKKSLGRIVRCHQPVPSIRTTFADSPNFFLYLHLKLLFGKVIHPECSQSHGLLSSEAVPINPECSQSHGLLPSEAVPLHPECSQSHGLLPSEPVPNKPTRKRRVTKRRPTDTMRELLSIHDWYSGSEDEDLKTAKWSAAKRVPLEDNNPPTSNDMLAPSSAFFSGFDVNVTGTSSEILSRQKNLAPVFPILKFRRRSTNQRSWRLAQISTPSSYKGRTSRPTTHVDSFQSRHTEPDLNKGHFVRENQREYNMLQGGTTYGVRMESSQSGCSYSISDNADDIMLKSERPARRGRPSRQQKKEKYKDVEMDSQTCAANILVFGGGESCRECGAEVALEPLSQNEWVLHVKIDGLTKFRYKAQQPKIPKAQEQKLPKAGEQALGNPNFQTIIWTGGQDWNLEFTERKQWSLFRKMYEECYGRNLRAASIRNIPIPTVREINVDNLSTVCIPFERPMNYIQTADDEVSRALDCNRVIYDMDSDDEEWVCRFNSANTDYGIRANKVSEDAFEEIIDIFEKAAFVQGCDYLTVDDALQLCSEMAPMEVLTSIHAHWLGKRKKKGKALIGEFQTSPSQRRNHGGKTSRGKPFRGQQSGKPFRGQQSGKSFIGQPYDRNWEVGTSSEMQQQFDGISSGSEGSSDAVDLISDARIRDAIRAAHAARENAAIKRERAQRLMQAADLATYRAVVVSRKAEAIRERERARELDFQTSEQFPSDSRMIENVNASGGSISSLFVQ